MLNIIKADFYRITKTKGFYLYWVAIIAIYGITIAMQQPGGINMGTYSYYDDATTLDICQLAANFTFYYLMLFQVYGVVVGDFSEKTIKNTISSAISRKTYFITKFIFTEIYVMVSFVIANIGFYFANRIVNSGNEFHTTFGRYMKLFVRQLPIMAGACALVILVAFVIKKAATFNALTILFPIVYPTILMIGLNGEEGNIMTKLLEYELSMQLFDVVLGDSTKYITNCTVIGLAVLVVSFVVGYFTFNKFELN